MRRIIFFVLPLFLFSCSGGNEESSKDDTAGKAKITAMSEWHALTESWNASLNLRNGAIMKSFYADTVLYYGDRISSDDVVKRQGAYFAANADYRQKITDYIDEAQQPDGSWRVRIVKQVTTVGKTANYPASLVYAQRDGIWKIISESDDITDITKATAMVVYYGEEVSLSGLLEETSGYPVTGDGDPKSEKRAYFILWPGTPLDVMPSNNKGIPERGVDRLQVTGNDADLKSLLNKKVKIVGTLSHAGSPVHFTKVLLTVKSIAEIK
jgi:hypothetical protein